MAKRDVRMERHGPMLPSTQVVSGTKKGIQSPFKQQTRAQQCRFCDITAVDCPQSVDEPNEAPQGRTRDF